MKLVKIAEMWIEICCYEVAYDVQYSNMIQFNSQSSGNAVTESYRACEMAASCNNVRKHHGGAVVFFIK